MTKLGSMPRQKVWRKSVLKISQNNNSESGSRAASRKTDWERMRVSHRFLMASPSNIAPKSRLTPTPLALLPPIPLYRRLLRAHRKLPADMRLLGDEYVKSEFRAHRNVDNPIHIVGFLTEWQLYAQKLEGDSWVEEKLDKEKLDKMNDQQVGQLYELMEAIKNKDAKGN